MEGESARGRLIGGLSRRSKAICGAMEAAPSSMQMLFFHISCTADLKFGWLSRDGFGWKTGYAASSLLPGQ